MGRHGGQFRAGFELARGRVHRRDRWQQGLRQQDVLRDLHPDRAVRRRERGLPGRRDGRRDLRRRADRVHGLHDVAERRLLVAEFVQIAVASAAEPGRRDLAGNREYRRAGGCRLLERGERGQGAGAGGEQQRGHFAGDPAVRVGGEARVVLDAQADVPERGAAQRVEHAERVLAGEAEDRGGAQPLEGLDDQVAAVAAGRRIQRGCGLLGGEPGVSWWWSCVTSYAPPRSVGP